MGACCLFEYRLRTRHGRAHFNAMGMHVCVRWSRPLATLKSHRSRSVLADTPCSAHFAPLARCLRVWLVLWEGGAVQPCGSHGQIEALRKSGYGNCDKWSMFQGGDRRGRTFRHRRKPAPLRWAWHASGRLGSCRAWRHMLGRHTFPPIGFAIASVPSWVGGDPKTQSELIISVASWMWKDTMGGVHMCCKARVAGRSWRLRVKSPGCWGDGIGSPWRRFCLWLLPSSPPPPPLNRRLHTPGVERLHFALFGSVRDCLNREWGVHNQRV